MMSAPACLNRTSVGLKPGPSRAAGLLPSAPQSNQRGIETIISPMSHPRGSWPQSNQRGIETRPCAGTAATCASCLNRTSVGLKHVKAYEFLVERIGLNRTSVGLKPDPHPNHPKWHCASIEPAWD